MKSEKESDSLTVSTLSLKQSERKKKTDSDLDNIFVSGGSTLIIKKPGKDNSLKRLNRNT